MKNETRTGYARVIYTRFNCPYVSRINDNSQQLFVVLSALSYLRFSTTSRVKRGAWYRQQRKEGDADVKVTDKKGGATQCSLTESIALLVVYFLKQDYRGCVPGGDRGVVISARAAVGVPFSFVFCGDSCTPPGPDGPGIPRGGPDNEKKKGNQNRSSRRRTIPLMTRAPLVVGNDADRRRRAETKRKTEKEQRE